MTRLFSHNYQNRGEYYCRIYSKFNSLSPPDMKRYLDKDQWPEKVKRELYTCVSPYYVSTIYGPYTEAELKKAMKQ